MRIKPKKTKSKKTVLDMKWENITVKLFGVPIKGITSIEYTNELDTFVHFDDHLRL